MYMLANFKEWALKALLKLDDKQTDSEKACRGTHDRNGVGFTRHDGQFLSSLAKCYRERGSLTVHQVDIVHKRIPKYLRQIIAISDTATLDAQVARYFSDKMNL